MLFEISENAEKYFLARAWAMEELAKRVAKDWTILERLLVTLGETITVEGRNGAPLGRPALGILLNMDEERVTQAIAQAASNWSANAQEDFFHAFFDAADRKAAFDRLLCFGMRPKIWLNETDEPAPTLSVNKA